jgi:DNA-binding CsgD family transcriptional regulator
VCGPPGAHPVEPAGRRLRRDSLGRRLALAKLRELRQAGLGYHDIAARFGASSPERAHEDGVAAGHHAPDRPHPALPARNGDAAALLRALDAMDQGLAFYDCGGALVHANRAVQRILEASPSSARLRAEIEHFAIALCGVVRLRGLSGHTLAEPIAVQELPADEERYRLRGSYVGLDLFRRGGSVLVALERPGPTLPGADALRERFGLSRQESRIACELARGRSNVQIAAALGISPHTARTHTQRVLEKLGARGRAEVAARLLVDGRGEASQGG